MQANLERGKAASGVRSAGRFVAISASGPLIVTLALLAPDRAHAAACGGLRRRWRAQSPQLALLFKTGLMRAI